MNRLQAEFDRLYVPQAQDRHDASLPPTELIDSLGRVRAMVMELARPANWDSLSKVWHGVQAEFDLPAPAIAVSGIDGLQLWFSVAEPIAVTLAHEFLDGIRRRYLPDIESRRVRLMPAVNASNLRQDLHAALVPAQQANSENWSAFLAPDLVPIFVESPWLDIAPNEEGQASLLRNTKVMMQPAFEAALERLGPNRHPLVAAVVAQDGVGEHVAPAQEKFASAGADPEQFLQQVMNDDAVALALRIEAAKALLQHASGRQRRPGV